MNFYIVLFGNHKNITIFVLGKQLSYTTKNSLIMTTNDILSVMTETSENVTKIQSQFYEVIKVPMVPFTTDKHLKNPANMYGVYNAKTGDLLSEKSMGKDFLPMQQQEFLDNILSTIHDFGADLDLNTLKFKTWGNGAKIEFSVKMYPISFKNKKGLQDITNMEMTFSTSYDGSKANRIGIFTERLVCLNGMTARKLEGELKGKNTVNGKNKILSYASEVAEIFNGANDFRNKMIALDKVNLSKANIETFKKQLLGFNQAILLASDKKSETRKQNILDNLDKAINIEFKRCGQTAFGLLQGVTNYTNHFANKSKKIENDYYIRFGQGAKTNDKAQEILFALVEN